MSEAGKRIFPVWFTLVVTLVFIAFTSVVYTATKDTIALNERVRLMRSVLRAAGVEAPEEAAEVEKLFTDRVKDVKDNEGNIKFYEIYGEDGSTVESYVLVRYGAGLWGTITGAVGIAKDLESFAGLDILDQSETPGLGARIGEKWFMEQFRGKRGTLTTVSEGQPANENQFQAITGATYSTNAVRDIVNGASEYGRKTIEPR